MSRLEPMRNARVIHPDAAVVPMWVSRPARFRSSPNWSAAALAPAAAAHRRPAPPTAAVRPAPATPRSPNRRAARRPPARDTPGEHPRTLPPGMFGELLDQTGLADPGIPTQQHGRRGPLTSPTQRLLQPVQARRHDRRGAQTGHETPSERYVRSSVRLRPPDPSNNPPPSERELPLHRSFGARSIGASQPGAVAVTGVAGSNGVGRSEPGTPPGARPGLSSWWCPSRTSSRPSPWYSMKPRCA